MKPFLLLSLLLSSGLSWTQSSHQLKNEAESIRLELSISPAGQPFYQLYYHDQRILDTSYLGIVLEEVDLSNGLQLLSVSPPQITEDQYELLHGKQHRITYRAQQYQALYQSPKGYQLNIDFNLSKNGLAYRYRILKEGEKAAVNVLREHSSFGFPTATRAWLQPMSKAKTGWKETNPSYEEHYLNEVAVSTPSPIGEGFVYPALFRVQDNWMLLSETNLHRNYCGSRIQYDSTTQHLHIKMPQAAEVFPGGALLPSGATPFTSPWRIMAIGSLGEIVESTLGTDLAAPAIDIDNSFIKSGLASWSWVLLKDDFTNYETSKKFIEYAAVMNWPYCLIDADWDQKIGYEKMQELIDYAGERNVGVLLWYNSSGSWNSTTYSPKSKLVDAASRRKEFARLQDMGVAGIKVDFFGGDGQSMIAYYHDILLDAAEHKLMLNFHGATLPRGWHRTYPHLMTVEAIKGGEFITFVQENADRAPAHCATIPFTRNVFDPMDFTPMVLDSIPNIQRRTTPAFELALPVLFTSGIQHIAEIPEGMNKMPDYVVNYLRNIPTQWEEVKLLDGYPGKSVVLARRKGDNWYIAGINGTTEPQMLKLDLSFADQEEGVLFYDGEQGRILQTDIKKGIIDINLPAHGGFTIKI